MYVDVVVYVFYVSVAQRLGTSSYYNRRVVIRVYVHRHIHGANQFTDQDMPTRLCMTFERVTCVILSKITGGDNSYLPDANMSCLHR